MKDQETMADAEPEKLDLRSADIGEERRRELLRLFPEVGTEGGKIDFDRLKLALGEAVDMGRERYGMVWPGKADCFRTIQAPSLATLRPCREESVEFDTTQNVIIEGDNLEVLKLLQKSYLGKVKMIYIDPPYNTGNDFIYPDNYTESLQTYLEYTGQVDAEGKRFGTNAETDGRFHSKWLNMMYPRLFLARHLLREDGAIFISIDDNELRNLRCLCDEVFGEENFLATIVWKKMDSPSRNDETRSVTNFHDYVLVFARSKERNPLRQMSKPEILEAYPLTLQDGRLARRRQLRKNGNNARREDRPSMWYPLGAPDGSTVWPVAPEGWEGRWVLSEETWRERERAGLTEWIQRDTGWTPYYVEIAPAEPSVPWSTLWTDGDQNRQAKAKFTELMGANADFDNPKPVDLVQTMLRMATSKNDLILDFFAGSGTTAQAVLELNASDTGQRRFILVQLPEPTGRAEYRTIAEITKERARRIGSRLREQSSGSLGLDDGSTQDAGFRVFKLAESNFKTWDAVPSHETAQLERQLELHVGHIRDGRSNEDLLYELLLKSGFTLAVPAAREVVAGKAVFATVGGEFLLCLERELTMELIRAMADRRPKRVVCLDEGFAGNDQLKANAVQIFKAKGVEKFLTV